MLSETFGDIQCSNSDTVFSFPQLGAAMSQRPAASQGDHPDQAGITKFIQYNQVLSGERVRVRGLDAPTGRLRVSAQWRSQAVSAMQATGSQNLRSGARGLRKYACGAGTKWETVHMGQKEQRAATVWNKVLAAKAKR
eukprot:6182389-Pleurochrysis_carterae.AAC.1